MKRYYYAIEYPCGLAVWANSGNRAGTYHRFPSPEERDAWVARGGDFRTSANWREPIPSKDTELRRAIRNLGRKGHASSMVWQEGLSMG